jgi:hypothetical protein
MMSRSARVERERTARWFGRPGVFAKWGFVLSPAVGAVLMSVSTVIVAINAQLLRRARM